MKDVRCGESLVVETEGTVERKIGKEGKMERPTLGKVVAGTLMALPIVASVEGMA